MIKKLSLIAISTALAFGFADSAKADLVVSGYSSFVDKDATTPGVQGTSGTGNGVVDFVVYFNPAGHDWVADLGLAAVGLGSGNPPVDSSASYVYFYEVVNTGTSSLEQIQIGAVPGLVSSEGYITGTVFADAGGAINGGNPYLGPNPGLMPQEAGGNGSPTSIGGFAGFASAVGVSPSGVQMDTGPSGTIDPNPLTTGFVQFDYAKGTNPILVGGNSTVLFLTSNSLGGWLTTALHDTVTTYNELPAPGGAPLPVPATIVLLLSGVPTLLGARFIRKGRA